mmetsp:Transcript_75708/g.245006  ORF Transcript_75708/g.245006 Transcript_75708/m.245006 type:complete len:229 (-) Transcript_75708:1116-1802(-)
MVGRRQAGCNVAGHGETGWARRSYDSCSTAGSVEAGWSEAGRREACHSKAWRSTPWHGVGRSWKPWESSTRSSCVLHGKACCNQAWCTAGWHAGPHSAGYVETRCDEFLLLLGDRHVLRTQVRTPQLILPMLHLSGVANARVGLDDHVVSPPERVTLIPGATLPTPGPHQGDEGDLIRMKAIRDHLLQPLHRRVGIPSLGVQVNHAVVGDLVGHNAGLDHLVQPLRSV